MSLLSDRSEEWLREFIREAISTGLRNHTEHIPVDVYEELLKKGWIDRASGNDGDCGRHEEVELDADFIKRLCASLNIYGILRTLIADSHMTEEEQL